MNILLLSGGRRVEVVREFKKCLAKYSDISSVVVGDLDPPLSAACYEADVAIKLPPAGDSSFKIELMRICKVNSIKLVVPLADHDLIPLSDCYEELRKEGVEAVISDHELVSICRDKRRTPELYERYGISYPRFVDPLGATFPIFCKPYDGSSSKGSFVIPSKDDLNISSIRNEKNIFQEFIGPNFSEYTCDLYFDRESKLQCLVPRKRLQVRGGEVSKGVTRRNFLYDYLITKLQELEGARGPITFQVFFNETTLETKALEINPRFGGGYPLTSTAGSSFVEYLIREYLLNLRLEFDDSWKENLLMLRYDQMVLSTDVI